jgi:hypothetical protein
MGYCYQFHICHVVEHGEVVAMKMGPLPDGGEITIRPYDRKKKNGRIVHGWLADGMSVRDGWFKKPTDAMDVLIRSQY